MFVNHRHRHKFKSYLIYIMLSKIYRRLQWYTQTEKLTRPGMKLEIIDTIKNSYKIQIIVEIRL